MSSTDVRYPAASVGNSSGINAGSSSPPMITPNYGSPLPNPPGNADNVRATPCATGFRFLTTIHGILNIIIIVSLVCVLISAGVANRQNCKLADTYSDSRAKVSAYNTRNAVLVFAAFGLFLILVDTILHATSLILRLPATFDKVFIIIMLVLAGIYLILGCCAAAWETKMRDTVGFYGNYIHKGSAASAAFWTFVAMIAIVVDFLLRLLKRPSQTYNPTAIINRNAFNVRGDSDAEPRF